MGLLADLIILGNFLLKGRTRRRKSISKGVSKQGCRAWGSQGELARGVLEGTAAPHSRRAPGPCSSALESRAAAGGPCPPRDSSAAVRTNNSHSTLKMLQSGTRARKSWQSCCCACCQGSSRGGGTCPGYPQATTKPECCRARFSHGSLPCHSGPVPYGLCCTDHRAILELYVPVLFRAGTVQG